LLCLTCSAIFTHNFTYAISHFYKRMQKYGTLTPYIVCKNACNVIEFMEKAFGGVVTEKIENNSILKHAELRIGTSMIMIGETNDSERLGTIYMYVEDVDKVYAQAISAGGISMSEPSMVIEWEVLKICLEIIGG